MKSFRLTLLTAALVTGFAFATNTLTGQAALVILVSCFAAGLPFLPRRQCHPRR